MSWFVFSLLNAFFESAANALVKKNAEEFDIYSMSWAQRFFSLVLLLPATILTNSFQSVDTTFWVAVVLNAILNTFIVLLFFKAIKNSPLSLALPIVTLTPVFLLITSPLIVGEYPTPMGVLGILITVFGSYVLNISKRKHGFLEPFRIIVKHKGTRMMLIVAFLWSITSNLDKIGIVHSNPYLFSLIVTCFILLFTTMLLFWKGRSIPTILKHSSALAPIGLATGLSGLCQMIAISMTIVPNVIAIKRTSSVFGVMWGRIVFHEKNIKERLLGSAIMVLGVVFIVLS